MIAHTAQKEEREKEVSQQIIKLLAQGGLPHMICRDPQWNSMGFREFLFIHLM
jgi:hypothetical protein